MRTRTAFFLIALLCVCWEMPVQAQVGNVLGGRGITLEQFNDSTLDRFGNPTFGFRAQREPEMRRLRKMAGRPVLEGRVSIYDLSDDEIDELFEIPNSHNTE